MLTGIPVNPTCERKLLKSRLTVGAATASENVVGTGTMQADHFSKMIEPSIQLVNIVWVNAKVPVEE